MHPHASVDTGMPGKWTEDAFTTTGILPSFSLPTVKVSCACTHAPPGQSLLLVQTLPVLDPPLHAGPKGNGIDRKSLAVAVVHELQLGGISGIPTSPPGHGPN